MLGERLWEVPVEMRVQPDPISCSPPLVLMELEVLWRTELCLLELRRTDMVSGRDGDDPQGKIR